MIVFSATVTTGTITFLGNSVNKGTINGNAIFKDTSQNGSGAEAEADEDDPPDGIINGSATFFDSSLNMNRGDITGTGTFNDCADNGGTVDDEIDNRKASCPPSLFRPPYQDFNPPVVAGWTFRDGGGARGFRRISVIGSQNGMSSFRGKWQKCPGTSSCREQPETYRNAAPFHYVLDARAVFNVNGDIQYVINYPDYYCLPENYTRPLNRGYWFDCDGSVIGPDGTNIGVFNSA